MGFYVVIDISLHIIGIGMCRLWVLLMEDITLIFCISILILSKEKLSPLKFKAQFQSAKGYFPIPKHVNFIQAMNF